MRQTELERKAVTPESDKHRWETPTISRIEIAEHTGNGIIAGGDGVLES